VVRVGEANCQGIVEISDMIFTTIGPGTSISIDPLMISLSLDPAAPGAIIVEWNVAQPSGLNGGAGMWDTHIRIGGSKREPIYI
jgi:hypothetical protein